MKQEEKNLQSRKRILDSALREFAAKGYGQGSVNAVCEEGKISKGNLYHYYRDKDELYLACVQECFESLTMYLRGRTPAHGDAQEQMEAYFDARLAYFRENPDCQRLFCEVLVSPPPRLAARIEACRADFDALNLEVMGGVLERVRLRPDVTKAEVLSLLGQFQDFINARCQRRDGQAGAGEREESCRRALSVLLYGVVER